jgi:hypothetical protein
VNNRHRFEIVSGECRFHLFRQNRLSPLDDEGLRGFAIRPRDLIPAFGERAVDATQNALCHTIANRGFLQAGAGRGGDVHALGSGKHLLQFGLQARVEFLKLFAAMSNHRLGLRREHLRDEHRWDRG